MFRNQMSVKDNEFVKRFNTDQFVPLYTIYDTAAHLVSQMRLPRMLHPFAFVLWIEFL